MSNNNLMTRLGAMLSHNSFLILIKDEDISVEHAFTLLLDQIKSETDCFRARQLIKAYIQKIFDAHDWELSSESEIVRVNSTIDLNVESEKKLFHFQTKISARKYSLDNQIKILSIAKKNLEKINESKFSLDSEIDSIAFIFNYYFNLLCELHGFTAILKPLEPEEQQETNNTLEAKINLEIPEKRTSWKKVEKIKPGSFLDYPVGTVEYESCETKAIIDSILLKGTETGETTIVLHWDNKKENTKTLIDFFIKNGYGTNPGSIVPCYVLFIYNTGYLKTFLEQFTHLDPSINQIKEELISSSKFFKQIPKPALGNWLKKGTLHNPDSDGHSRIIYNNILSEATISVLMLKHNNLENEFRLIVCTEKNKEENLKNIIEKSPFPRPSDNLAKGYTRLNYKIPNLKFIESFLKVLEEAEPSIYNVATDILETYQPGYINISKAKLAFCMGLQSIQKNESPIKLLSTNEIGEPKLAMQILSYLFPMQPRKYNEEKEKFTFNHSPKSGK